MKRDEIIATLQAHRAEIARRFAVDRIALFGSAARDALRGDSDVDVLVGFRGPTTYDAYLGLKRFLEDLLQRPVDLVTETGLKPRARANVERDLIRVP